MRVFISFPIKESILPELQNIQEKVIEYNPKMPVTWSKDDNMHVTLAFLGDVTEDRLEDLKKILQREIAGKNKFSYWLEAVSAFPNLNHPHVLVVAVGEELRHSTILRENIVNSLEANGFLSDEEKPWRPHITLGRIKRQWNNPVGLYKIKVDKKVWEVDKVFLMQSELTADGPIYTVLEEYELQ